MSDTLTREPAEGDPAPEIALPRDGGGDFRADDLGGAALVLFFYPKADTSGCTREALDFTALADDFAAAGCMVVGVSKDPIRKQDKFKAKHALNVALLSDEDGDVCERFGVWKEKSMYGKTYMGIERSTFLIRDGAIRRVWRKVKVPGHAQEVLEAARAAG